MESRPAEDIAQKTLGRSPKHILVVHENDLTAIMLDKLVAKIKSNGWKIITVEDAYTDPIAKVEPDTMQLGQGRVAAIAVADGYKGPIVNRWEDEKEIDKLVLDEGVFN